MFKNAYVCMYMHLSCLVLSCLDLSCLDLSRLVLSRLVLRDSDRMFRVSLLGCLVCLTLSLFVLSVVCVLLCCVLCLCSVVWFGFIVWLCGWFVCLGLLGIVGLCVLGEGGKGCMHRTRLRVYVRSESTHVFFTFFTIHDHSDTHHITQHGDRNRERQRKTRQEKRRRDKKAREEKRREEKRQIESSFLILWCRAVISCWSEVVWVIHLTTEILAC